MPLNEHLMPRFSDRLTLIEAEYRRSDAFRSLCEDLQVCAEALARWKQSDSSTSRVRVEEYTQWREELEQEIEEWLQR